MEVGRADRASQQSLSPGKDPDVSLLHQDAALGQAVSWRGSRRGGRRFAGERVLGWFAAPRRQSWEIHQIPRGVTAASGLVHPHRDGEPVGGEDVLDERGQHPVNDPIARRVWGCGTQREAGDGIDGRQIVGTLDQALLDGARVVSEQPRQAKRPLGDRRSYGRHRHKGVAGSVQQPTDLSHTGVPDSRLDVGDRRLRYSAPARQFPLRPTRVGPCGPK